MLRSLLLLGVLLPLCDCAPDCAACDYMFLIALDSEVDLNEKEQLGLFVTQATNDLYERGAFAQGATGSIITYNDDGKVLVYPTTNQNDLLTVAYTLHDQPSGGENNLIAGLDMAHWVITSNGTNKCKVVIIATESTFKPTVTYSSNTIKREGILIYFVAIGDRLSIKEIFEVASRPSSRFVYVAEYSALNETADDLVAKCPQSTNAPFPRGGVPEIPMPVALSPQSSTSLGPGGPVSVPESSVSPSSGGVPYIPVPVPKGRTNNPGYVPRPLAPFSDAYAGVNNVVFVLDRSATVGDDWNDFVIPFVRKCIKSMQFESLLPVNFGVIVYSAPEENGGKPYQVVCQLASNVDQCLSRVTTTTFGYEHMTYFAMRQAELMLLPVAGPGALIVLVTNNRTTGCKSTPDTCSRYTIDWAHDSKDYGIRIFAVGVGSAVSPFELQSVASEPTDKYLVAVDTFWELTDIEDAVVDKVVWTVNDRPPA